jgi:two-component system OmpR family sensor kinase
MAGWRGRTGGEYRRPILSVRFRILTAMLALTAVGLTAAGGTAYLLQRERIVAAVDDELRIRLDSVRAVIDGASPAPTPEAGSTGSGTAEAPTSVPPQFGSLNQAVVAVLERVLPDTFESTVGIVNGETLYVPGIAQEFQISDDEALLSRIVTETAAGESVIGTADSHLGTLRYVAVPLTLDGVSGQAVYVTAVRIESELAALEGVMSSYVVVALAALVATGLAGWFVAGRLLRPIRQLRSAASRITATDLHERIPVAGRDDVSELTRTVNDMVGRLETSFVAQQRLLDDVRHELNTPITIVRGHLELLDPHDIHDVTTTRALAIDELDRMTALVDDISHLAQAERPASIERVPTDVSELTQAVFNKARGMAGHGWTLAGSAGGVVSLDPQRITQAWLQLAENAAKYSDEGTPISLGSTVSGSSIQLWVTDAGPGIPPDARARVFERFGRVDAGRGVQGSGLGLAIAGAIAQSHGGQVTLESVVGRGSRFAIVLPLDDASAAHSSRGTQ